MSIEACEKDENLPENNIQDPVQVLVLEDKGLVYVSPEFRNAISALLEKHPDLYAKFQDHPVQSLQDFVSFLKEDFL